MLYEFERYNGWGYRKYHPNVLSAYLWSGTPLYRKGKYVADGKWSDAAVSKQVGAAALLVRVTELDESIVLVVDGTVDSYVEAPDMETPPPVTAPETFPKAEESRVTETAQKSRTLTGALAAAFGVIISYGEATVKTLLEAATQIAEWSPITGVMASLGANVKTIGFGMAVAGILLVVSRRFSAAMKGKIG